MREREWVAALDDKTCSHVVNREWLEANGRWSVFDEEPPEIPPQALGRFPCAIVPVIFPPKAGGSA